MSSAKPAAPIEMPLGLGTWVGPKNHVLDLDGGPAMMKDVAMAISFGTPFAITGFVGYNFGCMIGSDTLFDSRGGFLRSSYPMKTRLSV